LIHIAISDHVAHQLEYTMSTPTRRERESRTPDIVSISERTCPVCHGPLVEFRMESRCSRCAYAVCEACEGGLRERYDENE